MWQNISHRKNRKKQKMMPLILQDSHDWDQDELERAGKEKKKHLNDRRNSSITLSLVLT